MTYFPSELSRLDIALKFLFFFLNSTCSPSISIVSGQSKLLSGKLNSDPALGKDDCLHSKSTVGICLKHCSISNANNNKN